MRPELALDLGPPSSGGFVPQREAAPGEGRAAKLEEYVRRLEEERRKIEVFRRELPLCMLILNDSLCSDQTNDLLVRGILGPVGAVSHPVASPFLQRSRG